MKQYAFADDFVISSYVKCPRTIMKSLNKGLIHYARYCKKWKLKLNESKTGTIYFSRCTSRSKLPAGKLNIKPAYPEFPP